MDWLYTFSGFVVGFIVGVTGIGSLPGIYLGSHLGVKIPDRILRPILATMLMIIGGKLMLV